jgi:hypothetical protein
MLIVDTVHTQPHMQRYSSQGSSRMRMDGASRGRARGRRRNVERELINHRSLLHPNIIRFKEVFLTSTHLGIGMEYAAGGELFDRIVKAGRFSEDEARYFFQQLISGVEYCHSEARRAARPAVAAQRCCRRAVLFIRVPREARGTSRGPQRPTRPAHVSSTHPGVSSAPRDRQDGARSCLSRMGGCAGAGPAPALTQSAGARRACATAT